MRALLDLFPPLLQRGGGVRGGGNLLICYKVHKSYMPICSINFIGGGRFVTRYSRVGNS